MSLLSGTAFAQKTTGSKTTKTTATKTIAQHQTYRDPATGRFMKKEDYIKKYGDVSYEVAKKKYDSMSGKAASTKTAPKAGTSTTAPRTMKTAPKAGTSTKSTKTSMKKKPATAGAPGTPKTAGN